MVMTQKQVKSILSTDQEFNDEIDKQITDSSKKEDFMKVFCEKVSEYMQKPDFVNMTKISDVLKSYNVDRNIFRHVAQILKLPRLEMMRPEMRRNSISLHVNENYIDRTRAKTAVEGLETIKKDLRSDKKAIESSIRGGKAAYYFLTKDTTSIPLKVAILAGVSAVTIAEAGVKLGLKTAFNIARSGTKFAVKTIGRTYKAAKGTAEKHQEKIYQSKMALGKEILAQAEERFVSERNEAITDLEGVDIPDNIQVKLDNVRAGEFAGVEEFESSLENGADNRMSQMREELRNIREVAVRSEFERLGFSQEEIGNFLSNATIENGEIVFPERETADDSGPQIDEAFFDKRNSGGRKVNRELLEKVKRFLNSPTVEELTDEQVAALAESISLQSSKDGNKKIVFDRDALAGDTELQSFADNISGSDFVQEELEENFSNLNEASQNYGMLTKVLREVTATHGLNLSMDIREELEEIEHMKSGYDEREDAQGGLKESDKTRRMALRNIASRKVDMIMKKGLVRVIEDGNGQQRVVLGKIERSLIPELSRADNIGTRKLDNLREDYNKELEGPEL